MLSEQQWWIEALWFGDRIREIGKRTVQEQGDMYGDCVKVMGGRGETLGKRGRNEGRAE